MLSKVNLQLIFVVCPKNGKKMAKNAIFGKKSGKIMSTSHGRPDHCAEELHIMGIK